MLRLLELFHWINHLVREEYTDILLPERMETETQLLQAQTTLIKWKQMIVSMAIIALAVGSYLTRLITFPQSLTKMYVVVSIIPQVLLGLALINSHLSADKLRGKISVGLFQFTMIVMMFNQSYFQPSLIDFDMSGQNVLVIAWGRLNLSALESVPLKYFVILTLVERSTGILRVMIEGQSEYIAMICYDVARVSLLVILFTHLQRQWHFRMFEQDQDVESDAKQIVELIANIAYGDVYVFKLGPSSYQPEDTGLQVNVNRPRSKSRQEEEMISRFANGHLKLLINHKQERSSSDITLADLDFIVYNEGSSLKITNGLREVAVADLSPQDYSTAPLIDKVQQLDFTGLTVPEIMLELCLIFESLYVESSCLRFNFNYLTNYHVAGARAIKFYNVSIGVQVYEDARSVVLVVEDISQRVISESPDESDDVLNMNLSTIAHDMRAPLHAIACYTELISLRSKHWSLETNEAFKKVAASCQSLSSMVNDVLDSACLAAGSFELGISRFDFSTLCEECIDINRNVKDKTDVRYIYRGLKPCWIESDHRRVKRLLMNMLFLASRNSKAGTIEIQTVQFRNLIEVTISDTSKAIDSRLMRRIINPLARFKDRRNNDSKKTSLSLTAIKKLLSRLGPSDQVQVKSGASESSISFDLFRTEEDLKKHKLAMSRFKSSRDLFNIRPSPDKLTLRPAESKVRKPKRTVLHEYDNSQVSLLDPVVTSSAFDELEEEPIDYIQMNMTLARLDDYKGDQHPNSQLDLDTSKPRIKHSSTGSDGSFKNRLKTLAGQGKPTIFVLDDDEFNVEILIRFVERALDIPEESTNIIRSASLFDDAVGMVEADAQQQEAYALVLTDYHLDGSHTGAEFVIILTDIYTKHGIPVPIVVLVSGLEKLEANEKNLFDKVLTKPFSYDQFMTAVDLQQV